MNGKTDIHPINPCSAYIDKNTWGWKKLNICFHGDRWFRLRFFRLTLDIYPHRGRVFTSKGGGANGTARYWMLFSPLGKIQWITRKT
jgi:hypothetical protein